MPLPDHTKYRHLVDDPDLTDEQKDEMILTVWGIMSKLVDAIYDGTLDEATAKRPPAYNKKIASLSTPFARTQNTEIVMTPKRDRTA